MRAACLHRAMLEHALASARTQHAGHISLVCAPDTRHPLFGRLARRYGVTTVRQAQGDLGQRMHRALRWGLRRHARVVLMGSDQPVLDDDWIDCAKSALRSPHSVWIAPTFDGGYWAIGARRAEARIFRGPLWSSARVASKTRQRAAALGLVVDEHRMRRDIDEGRDWISLDAPLRQCLARAAACPALHRLAAD